MKVLNSDSRESFCNTAERNVMEYHHIRIDEIHCRVSDLLPVFNVTSGKLRMSFFRDGTEKNDMMLTTRKTPRQRPGTRSRPPPQSARRYKSAESSLLLTQSLSRSRPLKNSIFGQGTCRAVFLCVCGSAGASPSIVQRTVSPQKSVKPVRRSGQFLAINFQLDRQHCFLPEAES